MVSVLSLWLPILLSAVLVFLLSSAIHTVLTYHQSDVRSVPNEGAVMAALRPFAIPPGDYMMPRAATSKDMRSSEFTQKLAQGPVVTMTVLPNGPFAMGGALAQWFVYCLVIGIFAAYVAGRALAPGEGDYLDVFRFAGVTAFAGYALALPQASIWYRRSWATTLRSMFDGLVYALVTAGVFGWLWPSA